MTAGDMISKAGLICVTDSNGTGTLEAWLVPICGDSGAVLASPYVSSLFTCLFESIATERVSTLNSLFALLLNSSHVDAELHHEQRRTRSCLLFARKY